MGAYTDTLSEFGGDSFENTDRFLTTRTSGVATLRTKNLFGAVDGLSVGRNIRVRMIPIRIRRNSTAMATASPSGYDNIADSGVSAIAAYTNSSVTAQQKQNGWDGENAEFWGAGLKYDANAIYVATMYGESHNLIQDADKAQHFEAMAAYVFDFGLRPNVAYVHARDNNNNDPDRIRCAGHRLLLQQNMVADVGYKINLLDGKDGDNQVVAGLTYQF